jgi:hypothetical protein
MMTDDVKWERWKDTARELSESTTLNEGRRAVAGQLYKFLQAVDFKPERSSADPGLTDTELPQEPQFEHSCDRCVFLGQYIQTEKDFFNKYDLYFCSQHGLLPTVVARNGSKGTDLLYGLEPEKLRKEPALAEAKKRAIAKGLFRE